MRYVLVCLVFVPLSWGQAKSSESELAVRNTATQTTAKVETAASEQSQQAEGSNIAPDAPVITVDGLCDDPSADKTAASNCKIMITRAQFEKVIEAVQPNMPARARREFALRYVNALVMTLMAERMGLDKGANYEEQMKVARIQVLSRDLSKAIEERVSRISDSEIEDYYKNNMARFEKAELDRVYVPKTRQPHAASGGKLGDGSGPERLHDPDQTMKEEADTLHARAAAGEEFTKLQADAYHFAGINSAAPNTSLKVRRTSLPPKLVSIMDLKPGEVSSILEDDGGYLIYRVKTKDTLPLDQARDEIKATLRSQRMHEEMRGIEDSATPILDENYFRANRPPQGMPRAVEPAKGVSQAHSRAPNY